MGASSERPAFVPAVVIGPIIQWLNGSVNDLSYELVAQAINSGRPG
jgi:hypothetical protein